MHEPAPATRPYTVLSCAVSLDGYLDDAGPGRLRLSDGEDLDRVDEVRAGCDAILVGAATIRNDDPRLLVRSSARRAEREARGLPPSPTKVTVTEHLKLDPEAAFFTAGEVEKLVYCPGDRLDEARCLLGERATVLDAGTPARLGRICADLRRRGVRRLMVEGGATLLTQFLSEGLADELQLVVAPVFVGDSRGRRWLDDGDLPWRDGSRGRILESHHVGDVVLLRIALSEWSEPR